MTYTVYFDLSDGVDFDTLAEAKAYAEKSATYTQCDAGILVDEDEVATLRWYGYPASDDDEVAVDFGDFGFYVWEEAL